MVRGLEMSFWGLVAVALVAVVAGQDGAHRGVGSPPDHRPRDHGLGPPIGGQHGRYDNEPEVCSAEDSHNALEASSAYITCAEIDDAEFLALVQADIGLMEGAVACFNTKIANLETATDPDMADLEALFEECVNQVANTDGTNATAVTAEFLNKMLGPDTKICECLPAYVDKMPPCGQWQRFHHFGVRVEALCDTIKENGGMTLVDAAATTATTEPEEKQGQEAATTEVKVYEENDGDKLETSEKESRVPAHGAPEAPAARFPDNAPPCPPGQEQHPTDPTQCQPPQSEETEAYGEEPYGRRDDRGPPEGASGGFGLGIAVLGVVGVGSLIGVGGVWLWGKFQAGTRQPGVRYMATGLENDMETELGPFGREFA